MSKTQTLMAFVLCDVVAHGLKAGQILEASPDLVAALKKTGDVDPHRNAVAAAQQADAPVVRSSIELAVEQRQARADELRIELAKLQDLAAKPETDEPTKAALGKQQLALQAELADLG
jgi:hypothetical protein